MAQKKGIREEAWKLGLPEGRRIGTSSKDIMAKIVAQMKGKPEPPKPPPAPEPISVPQLPPIVDPKTRDRISGEEFLRSQGKFEVEASFGTYGPKGNFFPGVSAIQFTSLMKVLNQMESKNILTLEIYVDKVEIMEGEHIRRVTDSETGDISWEKKFRRTKESIENKLWGYRISKSEEKFEDPSAALKSTFSPDIIRHRTRHSFQVSDSQSDIYGYKFDLTHVREIHVKRGVYKKRSKTQPEEELEEGEVPQEWWEEEEQVPVEDFSIVKYEVEIERDKAVASKFERDPNTPITLKSFTNAIVLALMALQGVNEDKQLMTLPERQNATKLHNDLFAKDIREIEAKRKKKIMTTPFRLWKDYWNKPTNIRLDDLLNRFVNEYAITLKLDGVRRFILVTNTATYSAGPPDDLWKIGAPYAEYHNTLLDTEMYEEDGDVVYYVFDILFYKGRDVRGSRLTERLKLATEAVDKIAEAKILFDMGISMKDFITEGNFYERSNKVFDIAEKTKLRIDGLIFQPGNWYKNNHTRKWKSASQLTIDFRLKRLEPGKDDFALLIGSSRGEEITFRGTTRHPYEKTLHVPGGMHDGMNVDGTIAELKWDYDNSEFIIDRIRPDRDKPNAQRTAFDVWEDIHNPISSETIKGDTLQAMRRYHNIIKGDMLKEEFEKRSVIMDWGSGRGGDLKKWEDANIAKVFVVEPNETNLEELERRLEEMVGKGYDASRVEIVRDSDNNLVGGQSTEVLLEAVGDHKLDGITAFFSLTYFGKDSEMFNGMIDSVDQLLDKKGKFVGIVMDGTRVRDELEKSKEEQGFGEEEAAIINNPSFEIAQVTEYSDTVIAGKNEIEISINDPNSMVKNQQEWLFYFEIMERELTKRNFKLLKTGFLDKGQAFDVLPKDSKLFSKLNRYFVFQRTEVKKKKVPKIPKRLEFGVDDMIEFENVYDLNLYKIGVIRDNSSFIHSAVRAFHTEYYDMSEKERIDYIKQTRKMMSRIVTKKIYNQLNNGKLAEMYTSKVLSQMGKSDASKAEQLGFQEYRLDILDYNTYIGQQKGLELLSTLLNINILVLDSTSKPIVHLYDRDVYTAREAVSMYGKTVVLITEDNINYSLVANKIEDSVYTVFDTESNLIQDILNEGYPLMSVSEDFL